MPPENKRILIIDEAGFSRICSAILEIRGYGTDTVSHLDDMNDLPSRLNSVSVDLIVMSYPYGAFLFDEIKKRNIPTIILSDNIDGKLIDILNNFNNSHCMIKPLDYDKFKTLVHQVINGKITPRGGYSIV
jgi:DNA-binding NtrC family response regulator